MKMDCVITVRKEAPLSSGKVGLLLYEHLLAWK